MAGMRDGARIRSSISGCCVSAHSASARSPAAFAEWVSTRCRFCLPLLFQVGFGLSPLQSGLLSFSSSLGAMLVRTCSGAFLRVFGFRRLLAGDCLPGRCGDRGLRAVAPRHPGLVDRRLGPAVGVRAQHPVSRSQHDQLCRRAGVGLEQEHQRRRRRPTTGQGLWGRRRRGATRADRRASDADDR